MNPPRLDPRPALILDATVILNFARIEHLEWLRHWRPGALFVGSIVLDREALRWPRGTRKNGHRLELASYLEEGVLVRLQITDEELPRFAQLVTIVAMDEGESEAVTLAESRGLVLVTDDQRAMTALKVAGVRISRLRTQDLLNDLAAHASISAKALQHAQRRLRPNWLR